MRPLTTLRIAAGLTLATGAGIAIWFTWSRRQTTESIASLVQQRTSIEAELQRAQVALAAVKQKREPRPRPATTGSTPPPAPPRTAPPYGPTDALKDDPALQALYLKSEHSKIRAQYGELFLRLNLTPEQIEAFARNFVRRREQTMDLNAIAQRQNQADRKAIASLRKQSADEYQQAQQTLLGESGYKEFQKYESVAQPRETAAGLAGLLATMDLPLSAHQGAQLADLMANAVDLKRSNNKIDLSYADWAAIDRGAESILTAAQLAAFRTLPPADGAGSRWMSEFSAALLSAYGREVPEPIRNPPAK